MPGPQRHPRRRVQHLPKVSAREERHRVRPERVDAVRQLRAAQRAEVARPDVRALQLVEALVVKAVLAGLEHDDVALLALGEVRDADRTAEAVGRVERLVVDVDAVVVVDNLEVFALEVELNS